MGNDLMSGTLKIHRAGPTMTVQDLGRPGHMANGLSCGGAADRTALAEGAALLGQDITCAALEMAGVGGEFEVTTDARIALTGAPMKASLDGQALAWNASHMITAGQRLSIGPTLSGTYGYLHIGGGIATPAFLNSRAAHLAAGIGAVIQAGDALALGTDPRPDMVGQKLAIDNRFNGGMVRILPSVQTARFSQEMLARFQSTTFSRTPRGNRQGIELAFDGAPFASQDQLTILSEPMMAGDIQMTGTGIPFVLLPECQTTGGYPRIGTVLPDDLPLVAQATPSAKLTFRFIDHSEATAVHRSPSLRVKELASQLQPLIRDPLTMRDLLSYQLISGMITGRE
ncbi:urea amidolyase [Litoreibacter sp.]|nr:urea amidolyase [Litoreibacter sp.]